MAAAVLFAAVMAGGCATPAQFPDTIKVQDVNDSEGITVTGKEEVKVVPDMTEIRYGVYSQAQTASQCQEDNAKQLDQTIETLKGLGVEETSIQTSAYGLSPIYDWNSGNRTITGYEMNTEITVSDIPIDQAGEILSQSVTAGVNQIESVTYFSSQYDENYQEALKGAVAMARSKAEAFLRYGYNPQASTMEKASDMAVMPGEVRYSGSTMGYNPKETRYSSGLRMDGAFCSAGRLYTDSIYFSASLSLEAYVWKKR